MLESLISLNHKVSVAIGVAAVNPAIALSVPVISIDVVNVSVALATVLIPNPPANVAVLVELIVCEAPVSPANVQLT